MRIQISATDLESCHGDLQKQVNVQSESPFFPFSLDIIINQCKYLKDKDGLTTKYSFSVDKNH